VPSHQGVLRNSSNFTGTLHASVMLTGLKQNRRFLVATKHSAVPHLDTTLHAVTAQYRNEVFDLTSSLDQSHGQPDPHIRPEIRAGRAAHIAQLS